MDYFNVTDIHRFQCGDLYIVLDVNSGSVHVVDQLTWDVLEALEQTCGQWLPVQRRLEAVYGAEALEEVKAELDALADSQVLFTADDGEHCLPDAPVVKSLCLHVAHDCNLRCKYCFASSGHFGGERLLMDPATGKKALDFLLANSGSRKVCEVDFFGGEPLMNFPVVQELVAYGKEAAVGAGKSFKFTLTTNGVLLTEEIEKFLNEENISVVLSIDGRPEINDRMRPTAGRRGSYSQIVPKYKRFIQSRNNEGYYVRGTYTRYNLDFSSDVVHLFDLGFTHLSVEPVVAPPEEDYAFRPENLDILKEEYEKLAQIYLERYFAGQEMDFFHFNVELDKGPCLPKRLTGCGAGYEYLAVTPEGDFYPCHQFVGRPEYLLGNVEQGIIRPDLSNSFREAHIYNKEACRTCWARFHCSGGCHANAHAHNGNIWQPYEFGCELQKKRLECAIYVQVMKRLASTK
ncbi:thioether cross-link-forming SCIFF peptide maturase [Zhaonella formicivorans]|uniref:thioether cross-link-forming SCIFF peptide maturase n=1 Tax=Zhaonella formicivorans TaxID=2528593 RepID=UPI0010E08DA1|nr:thioether cross-link-forming SCIFF peptide maturase [Zhaonella formicivorans]